MRAGWATTDITPPLGLPMGGRGPRFAAGAEVLDPLQAQALVLEDDTGRRALWLSVDLIGVTATRGLAWRYELAAITGIGPQAVLVNFSHTHAGPMVNLDGYAVLVEPSPELLAYEGELLRRLLRVAVEAVDDLRPATVRLHRGRSDVGINRRGGDPATGEIGMRPDPEGCYVADLWALDVCGDAGGRAVAFVYGCHPVIVYGFAWTAISAGYPGVARQQLAQRLGSGTHCQFVQSLAGDVRPRVLADLSTGAFRKSVPADVEDAGTQLAVDVVQALSAPGRALQLSLAAASGTFLARRDPAAVPAPEHWRELVDSDDELTGNLARYWVDQLQRGVRPVAAAPWPAGLLRLDGDILVAWLAGEAVAEWLPILRACAGPEVIPWGYTQSVATYLPTDELLPQGGYEAARANRHGRFGPGPFAPGLDEAARRCFQSLRERLH